MKIQFTFFLILFYFAANAQTINFKINGEILYSKNANYAYLTTLSQQIPISSDKLFIKVPVVNGKFEFNSSFDLEGRNLQFANIFFDERDNITKDEIALKYKNLIWITGVDSHLIRIVLENMTLQVKGKDEAKDALIQNDGILTSQFNEYSLSVKNQDLSKLVSFIKDNRQSPIALIALETVTFFDGDDLKKLNESLPKLFYILATKLKESKDGQEIKKKLNIK